MVIFLLRNSTLKDSTWHLRDSTGKSVSKLCPVDLTTLKFFLISVFWNTYGECENIAVMSGHAGAVLELHFTTDGVQLLTCSTDKTVALWDIAGGVRVKRFKGHSSIVNCCQTVRRGQSMFCSGSDDGTVRVWDPRRKQQATTLNSGYQVTAVSFSDNATQVFSGGIDNDIKVGFPVKNNNS